MVSGCNEYERSQGMGALEASVSAGRIVGNGNSSLERKADIEIDR